MYSSRSTNNKVMTFLTESQLGAFDLQKTFKNQDPRSPLKSVIIDDEISGDGKHHEKTLSVACGPDTMRRVDNTFHQTTFVSFNDKIHAQIPRGEKQDQCKKVMKFFKGNGVVDKAALSLMCTTPYDSVEKELEKYSNLICKK